MPFIICFMCDQHSDKFFCFGTTSAEWRSQSYIVLCLFNIDFSSSSSPHNKKEKTDEQDQQAQIIIYYKKNIWTLIIKENELNVIYRFFFFWFEKTTFIFNYTMFLRSVNHKQKLLYIVNHYCHTFRKISLIIYLILFLSE